MLSLRVLVVDDEQSQREMLAGFLGKQGYKVKTAESAYQHIHWLQERFPNAEYEDVTGLCKLANLEEIEELLE